MASHPVFELSGPPDRTWAEVDLDAIRSNLRHAQRRSAGDGSSRPARIIAVVKADAYGHGADHVAPALADQVFGFAVANNAEAAALAESLRSRRVEPPRIFLLSPSLPWERRTVIEQGWSPVISSLQEAVEFEAAAAALGKQAPVQLVIDTGMGRVGILPAEARRAAAQLAALRHVRVESVASHFPSADEDADFTRRQCAEFRSIVGDLRRLGLRPQFTHIANSAGLLGCDHEQEELMRVGLLLYGVSPLPQHQADLRPALTWKSRVTLVRDLPAGQSVSYGRTWTAPAPFRAATVAVGYADGYQRHLSNRGAEVLISGVRCPVLGRVTMDQIVVDVTRLPIPPQPGEEVVLLGKQGREEIPCAELAERAGTIPWEIFTGIGRRVRRIWQGS